jgi:hypothetical protein
VIFSEIETQDRGGERDRERERERERKTGKYVAVNLPSLLKAKILFSAAK